jgi:hypothetical protein
MIPVAISGGGTLVETAAGQLGGYSFAEATGLAPATVRIHNGRDASPSSACVPVNLAAGESVTEIFLFPLDYVLGIFIEVVTGVVAGSVFVGH